MKTLFLTILIALPLSAKDDPLELAGRVHTIFEQKCNECHGSHLKKPEGKFGYVLDLQRMADNLEYVVRGKPADSDLFRMVRDEEMPPDDHPKTPPLTKDEKDAVRRWIAIGAPSALPPNLPKAPSTAPSDKPVASTKDTAKQKRITLAIKDMAAGEAFAEIAKSGGIKVDYTKPTHEPKLSITLKNGTVFEALEYLALCGNFSFTFSGDTARIGPNPPPQATK